MATPAAATPALTPAFGINPKDELCYVSFCVGIIVVGIVLIIAFGYHNMEHFEDPNSLSPLAKQLVQNALVRDPLVTPMPRKERLTSGAYYNIFGDPFSNPYALKLMKHDRRSDPQKTYLKKKWEFMDTGCEGLLDKHDINNMNRLFR